MTVRIVSHDTAIVPRTNRTAGQRSGAALPPLTEFNLSTRQNVMKVRIANGIGQVGCPTSYRHRGADPRPRGALASISLPTLQV